VGTNPSGAGDAATDLDGDGLSNLQEYQAGTDAHNADSDSDEMSDRYEQQYGIGPLSYNPSADPDSDGLTNLEEFVANTNPTDADTDNDGIPDGSDPNPRFNPAILAPILQLLLE
jgi:hypothetical protein